MATGLDAAGRKQYRYHDRWEQRRAARKYEQVREFARLLPRLRRAVTSDLARDGMPRERALACAVRLLDLGFFRVGPDDLLAYRENGGWSGTVLAAATLAGEPKPKSDAAAKRTIAAAVKSVAAALGNTLAVCRRSYIDPRVFDRYRDGVTVEVGLSRDGELTPRRRARVERAVLDLVS